MPEQERRDGMNQLTQNVALLTQSVQADIVMTKKVHDRLFGNGDEGLITTVAVNAEITENNEKSIGRLWKAGATGVILCLGWFGRKLFF